MGDLQCLNLERGGVVDTNSVAVRDESSTRAPRESDGDLGRPSVPAGFSQRRPRTVNLAPPDNLTIYIEPRLQGTNSKRHAQPPDDNMYEVR